MSHNFNAPCSILLIKNDVIETCVFLLGSFLLFLLSIVFALCTHASLVNSFTMAFQTFHYVKDLSISKYRSSHVG